MIIPISGLAAEMDERRVDFPALGNPQANIGKRSF